eukprot:357058-Chlamydomonas_euryale.AAC.5
MQLLFQQPPPPLYLKPQIPPPTTLQPSAFSLQPCAPASRSPWRFAQGGQLAAEDVPERAPAHRHCGDAGAHVSAGDAARRD